MASASDEIKHRIMRSIDDVGVNKAVGYLPVATLEDVLNINVTVLAKRYEARGLKVKIFDDENTCIKSGAIFVYDYEQFRSIIATFRNDILKRKWKCDVEFILNKIASHWFDQRDSIIPLIKALYGE